MKKIICAFAFLFLAAGIVSCSGEDNSSGNAAATIDPSAALGSTSDLTQMLSTLTNNQTALTTLIDNYSCFNIAFPVEVLANGQSVTLQSEADYALVEAIFNQDNNGLDTVVFVFPITVTYDNYQQVSVGSQQTLNSMIADCALQTAEDLIDCVSLNYPINILGYNSNFELTTTTTVNNDMELFLILFNLGSSSHYAIQYPISFNGYDGQAVTVNTNAELAAGLQTALQDCQSDACNTANTPFQQIYASLAAMPNVTEEFTMDAFTHEYTFKMSVSGTVCSIGYKAEQQATPIIYLIELLDENGTAVYSGNHSFSSTVTEYVSIPPVSIQAGQSYTLKRSISSYAVGSGIGTQLRRSQNTGAQPVLLPYTQGVITIENSRYYGGGGTLDPDYYSLPDIDFVFKSN